MASGMWRRASAVKVGLSSGVGRLTVGNGGVVGVVRVCVVSLLVGVFGDLGEGVCSMGGGMVDEVDSVCRGVVTGVEVGWVCGGCDDVVVVVVAVGDVVGCWWCVEWFWWTCSGWCGDVVVVGGCSGRVVGRAECCS